MVALANTPNSLPRTIQDACTVTRQLGMRYLWIDRYYIEQHDAVERHNQIRQMDDTTAMP